MGQRNPFNPREVVFDGGAVEAYPHDGAMWLKSLRAVERGGGRRALEKLLAEVADKNSLRVTLSPTPFDAAAGKRMTEDELRAWYRKFGFEDDEYGDMLRRPR